MPRKAAVEWGVTILYTVYALIGIIHASAPTNTTVLVVDDRPFMRNGILSVLEAYEDVQVVGEASDGLEAIQYARMLKPHVILMDINMPQMDGIQAARIIKQENPETIIVGLGILENVTMPTALFLAAFTSYLDKGCIVEDVYPTITQCCHPSAEAGQPANNRAIF